MGSMVAAEVQRLVDVPGVTLTGPPKPGRDSRRIQRRLEPLVVGYEVVQALPVDTLPAALAPHVRRSLDLDTLWVWSDDPCVMSMPDGLPELPITRLPPFPCSLVSSRIRMTGIPKPKRSGNGQREIGVREGDPMTGPVAMRLGVG